MGIAVAFGASAVGWWALSDPPSPRLIGKVDSTRDAEPAERTERNAAEFESAAIAGLSDTRPHHDAPAQDRTLTELEQTFLASTDKQVQLDAAAEIAGHNDEAAVQTLARLFRQTPHPDVKEGVLAALGDIDPETAPTARITLLQGALFGQPRSVRLAALDALAQFEDPRAAAALQRAAREDPDKLIREAAAAFAGVVENEAR